MGDIFTTLDFVLFFAALFGVMVVGLIAGRKEDTSEDYFLAGRKIPWWGVAGSIYGSNVSANHMVGMMGVGFTIGFAQSHFELGAILGLMVLCYGFLPVYRKLNVFTLSEYLEKRYDHRSRLAYSIIMTIIMAVVQLVPGLYIGSRTICTLLGDQYVEEVEVDGRDGLTMSALKSGDLDAAASTPVKKTLVKWNYYAIFAIALAAISAGYTILGGLKAVVWTDFIQSMLLLAAGLLIAVLTFQKLVPDSGGLSGVVDGWNEMMAQDKAADEDPDANGRMHLYLPMKHPVLPWTGVFTGLMCMHCFYWGTNQFIVQRALGARSDSEARLGIVAAGFLKLLIPFFAIGTGVAAYYYFQSAMPDRKIASDAAFSELVPLVIPVGYGLIGLISAGLIGAILSSIDSMMNSAATLFTIDVYRRYYKPDATDHDLIRVGRYAIVVFVTVATLMALFVLDPNSESNFFIDIANYQNYLTPGLLIAFFFGMFWKRGTGVAAFITIIAGVAFSWGAEQLYVPHEMNPAVYDVAVGDREFDQIKVGQLPKDMCYTKIEVEGQEEPDLQLRSYEDIETDILAATTGLTSVNRVLGPGLNFFHRVVLVLFSCGVLHVVISMFSNPDEEKSRFNWTELGGHTPADLRKLASLIVLSIGFFAVLGFAMTQTWLSPGLAATVGAIWTVCIFQFHIQKHRRTVPAGETSETQGVVPLLLDDRFWASFLCAAAVFMHYYYY